MTGHTSSFSPAASSSRTISEGRGSTPAPKRRACRRKEGRARKAEELITELSPDAITWGADIWIEQLFDFLK